LVNGYNHIFSAPEGADGRSVQHPKPRFPTGQTQQFITIKKLTI